MKKGEKVFEENDEFFATIDQYKKFKSNDIWKDMEIIVRGWVQACLDDLADPFKVDTLESLADMQGRIYMCNLFLNLPDTAISILEAKELEDARS